MKYAPKSLARPDLRRFFHKVGQQGFPDRDSPNRLLFLFSAFYEAGARARRGLYRRGWGKIRCLPAPVVSVGNLAAGGTGKTPVTAYLARLLQEQGRRVAILSRGYGGRRRGVTCLSDGERLFHQPPEVGDEAFQLARSLPGVIVYTGPSRFEAGMAAWRDLRPDVFLLDDGLQHFQLARDLDLVLLDAARPFGNGRLLPAGPLREPVCTLREADALLLTRYDHRRHGDRLAWLRQSFPDQEIFTAVIAPVSARPFPGGEEHPVEALRGLGAFAFAGIARPQVFRETLNSLGVDIRGWREFPDHHAFTPEDLAALSQEARRREAQALITTSKDWARLGENWPGDTPLWVLEVEARMEPEDALRKCLGAALGDTVGRESPPGAHAELEAYRPTPPRVRRDFRKLTRTGRPPAGPATIRRILVMAPNWVGDAVMSLPVLSGLTRLFPAARITVLAIPTVAPLFAGQGGVAEVISYPPGLEKWPTLLGLSGRFELALALPNSFGSALDLWLSRTPSRLGYAADGRSPLLTTVLKGRVGLAGLHQVFYYLGLLEAWGPVREFSPPRIHLFPEEIAAGREILSAGGSDSSGPWVGLAPGAGYGPAKRWPAERFAALGDLLQTESQARLVLLGGPGDREAAAEVQRRGGARFLNLAGKTTLRQALAILAHLRVLITNDSGLMHAAAALGTPLVAIFGSTDAAATGPFTHRAAIIHHHLPCSPCLERTCSQGYACLLEITVSEVAAAARTWLEER
jgi:tetraacyldisaccharide 4'-kinase/lipopolysaccharide heptosyltransferase II